MKIDVYQEQYRSKQAYHEPGKIGFGFNASVIKDAGDALIGAAMNKVENDDELNSARIEADTMFEADKMLRDFKANADPENFEQDMTNQRNAIQTLIKDQSKNFKLAKNQQAFTEKMTRGLEENYIGQALSFSYKLQDAHAQNLVKSSIDSFKAQLLAGNSLVTPQSVIQNIKDYATVIGQRFKVDQDTLDKFVQKQISETITSYAYGVVDADPLAIKNMLLGDNFDKFKAAQEEAGNSFTMEEFWANPELQKEYRESEFGANWVDMGEYLDYPTRMTLWQVAMNTIDKQEKEALKQQLAANSYADWEVDQALEAAIAQCNNDGTIPSQYATPSTITALDDPALGSKNEVIKMGEAKKGPLEKGNSYTKEGLTFANGIDGGLRGQGYTTYITSNLRPDDKDSQHATASAVDIQVFSKGNWSLDGSIKAYAEAVKKYGNHMRKGGTLFEIDPNKLSYVKTQLEQMGIDTSYVNWSQSAKYGEIAYKENHPHIHFGIDPKADYTKTDSGSDVSFHFQTQVGKMRYMQQRAAGKDPKTAYGAALKDETKLLAAKRSYTLVQGVITQKNSDGTVLDPAQYGNAIIALKNSINGNTKMSDSQRIIELAAIEAAEKELTKAQKLYNEDPAQFTATYYRTTDPNQIVAIQQGVYNIAPTEARAMTEAQAKTEATKLSRMTGEQFVNAASNYTVNDILAISKYMDDPDKSGLFAYVGMASPKGKADIQKCITNWDTVKQFIEQEKNSGRSKVFGKQGNWKAYVQGELNKNPMMEKYLNDITKTNPQAKTQLIGAMTTLYAYRASEVGSGGDPKAIIQDMVNDFIGESYNTLSVRNPYWGGTDVNISRQAFNSVDAGRVKTVLEQVTALGVNPNKIGAFDAQALRSGSEKLDAASKITLDAKNKADHEANVRTAVLTGSYDGMTVSMAYGSNKKQVYSGEIMRSTDGRQIKMNIQDLVAIDKQAEAMIEKWHRGGKDYYIPGSGKYTPQQSGSGKYLSTSRDNAKKAAIEHLLTKKYPWLGTSDYTNFVKRNVWVSVYDSEGKDSIYDPKARKKAEDLNIAKGQPLRNYKGVYDIYYDENGKEVSRKKVKGTFKIDNNPENHFAGE